MPKLRARLSLWSAERKGALTTLLFSLRDLSPVGENCETLIGSVLGVVKAAVATEPPHLNNNPPGITYFNWAGAIKLLESASKEGGKQA